MYRPDRRLGYFIAVVGSAVVVIVRVALDPALAEQARLLPFVLAVMAAAWWGGLGPGLLATMLSVFLGVLFVVPPAYSLRIDSVADGLNAVIFVFVGITISWLCDALHSAWRRDTEQLYRTLADSIPQLVWMARPDGYRFWFNRRWQEYTGVDIEQLAGFGWQSYCEPAERERVKASWQSAVARHESWEEAYTLRRKDGQTRWHLVRAVPITDAGGEIVRWFGTSTDIQDRIAAEQALKEAERRKDMFLATLAHELRNPLAPISNVLQLWPHIVDDKKELESARQVVERQLRQLVRLIDDLLDLSRITRGAVSLRRKPLDLRAALHSAVEAAQPLIDAAQHRLTLALPAEPLCVNGDLARLTQVFSNILNNAAKYSARNGAIRVTAERHDDFAVVRIRDTGVGIPPEMLQAVFEPFQQVDATMSRSHGGLGLGLWLSRELIELHGGSIAATSKGNGCGSEFVVSLPAIATVPNRVRVDEPEGSLAAAAAAPKILVVNDLPESADTLVEVLRHLGHDATAVHDGHTAIAWVLAHRPDIVLLDVAMPYLDGYEVARRLRDIPHSENMLLIALTGYGQADDRRRAFEAGFDAHLTKPVDIAEIQRVFHTLCQQRKNKIAAPTLASAAKEPS